MLLPDGRNEYRTFTGGILSIVTVIVMLGFAGYKFSVLVQSSDYKVQMRLEEGFYEDSDPFGIEDDFMIAAAITGDFEPMYEIDPAYGDLKLFSKSWNYEEYLGWRELEWEFCPQDYFQYGSHRSDQPRFYETFSTIQDMEMYSTSLRCIKNLDKDSVIWGNFNTGNATAVLVMFEKCDSEKNQIVCKSEEEINQWLKGRYIIVLENQKKFQSYKFGNERFKESAEVKWYPLNPDARTEYVSMVTRINTELYDSPWTIAELDQEISDGHSIELQPSRTMGYNNRIWNGVTYEISLTSKRYFRRVYGIMDFMAEMGGLFGAFGSIFLAMVVGFNYFGSYQFVMAELFYDRTSDGSRRASMSAKFIGKKKVNNVQWNALKTLMLNLYTFAPKVCLRCCKPNRAIRMRAKGFTQVLKETNILYIIQ